jgi:hypothetical protein
LGDYYHKIATDGALVAPRPTQNASPGGALSLIYLPRPVFRLSFPVGAITTRLCGFHYAGIADMKLDWAFAPVICGLGLAACTSSDAFKPKPTTTALLIQSTPPGVDTRSSLGGTCPTPCTMAIGTADDFTISFAHDGYAPQTITVHSTMSEGSFTTGASPGLSPNPVVVMLEPQAKPPVRQQPQPPAATPRVQ